MFSSLLYYQRPNKGRASSLLAKYLNAGALVFAMLVALLLVDAIHENKSGINPHQTPSSLTARPFVGRMINAVKDAFNDPSITAYANEQGFDLPDSPTAPPPTTGSQPSACSKSASTQSTKSASGH